jgi:hypothetical protein
MELKELSRWFWDVAKYVASAIVISSFLGHFQDNTLMLYMMSFAVIGVFTLTGTILYMLSKRK